MALTNWGDILNKPKGVDEVPEIALTVEQLSASVLSISEDVGEIALDVSQLSASVLSIAGDVEEITEVTTEELTTGIDIVRCNKNRSLRFNFTPETQYFYTLSSADRPKIGINTIVRWKATNNKYYPALLSITDDGIISASYISESTVAPIADGTIVGTINYITN